MMGIPDCLRENVPLAGLTTFGIGGPARWLARPGDAEELAAALAWARGEGLEVRVLGGGSNLLAADSGFAGMAIQLPPRGGFGETRPLAESPPLWRAGAAVGLPRLLDGLAGRGAAGLEFLAGVPGTLGGAAAMNAGGAGSGIGEFITEAEFVDFNGGTRTLRGGDLAFAYRQGPFRGGVAVSFVLRPPGRDEPEAIRIRMRERLGRKRLSQPLDRPSAGCVFRNPPGDSAGRLLDWAGCKGMREGGAMVSLRHANFIVNAGGATARGVAALAGRMRAAVAERGGPKLETEIVMWGDEPEFAKLAGETA